MNFTKVVGYLSSYKGSEVDGAVGRIQGIDEELEAKASNERVDELQNQVDEIDSDLGTLEGTVEELNGKISDAENEISNINSTINSYGDIVTYNASNFATAEQGALADTSMQPGDDVSELNNDAGYISGIDSEDVVTALGYTPYDSANPDGYITGITSSDVTTALGYTPYNSTNPNGYISSASLSMLTDATISNPSNGQVVTYDGSSGKWKNANIPPHSWGSITGTLSNQTDLQNALNAKQNNITGAASSVVSDNLTASKALVSNSSGKIAVSTVTVTELGYLSGVTSSVQAQINTVVADIGTINGKIPAQASVDNQLADKDFVNSSIQTASSYFDGSWPTWADVPSTVAGFTNEGYEPPALNNYMVVVADETQDGGTWRYKYTSTSTTYDKSNWKAEYQVNETPLTAEQLAAINSGITSTLVAQIGTNENDISSINTTLGGFGDIVTHSVSEFATAAQGTLADSALQPGDNISELNNDTGYITGITSSDVTTALGYTPYNSTNPNGYISSASLSMLTDATISNPSNGQVVMYNSANSKWENTSIPMAEWGQIVGTLSDQSDLQTALNNKQNTITGAASSITGNDLTANKVLMSSASGKVAASSITTTELGYLSGVTSNLQTQINGKTTMSEVEAKGYITGITSSDITTALGYTPEDIANKVTTISSTSTNSEYPSALCVYNAIQAAGATSLEGLTDVEITSPTTGQTIMYDALIGKWKNSSSTATVAWGGITGDLADQTDLKDILDIKSSKYSITNPVLESSNNEVTWTFTNPVGSKKVEVCVYEVSTYKKVMVSVSATDLEISIKLISNSNLLAGTYEAIIIG